MASQARSESAFERQIRISLSNDQFRNAIADTSFLPKNVMQRYQALSDQKRDIEVYTLKVQDVVKDIKITDAMAQSEYEKNPHLFQTDELVKVAYVELNKTDISKSLEVTDELLESYFVENEDRYTDSAAFKMSHIKVGITEGQDDGKAKAKADSLYSQIASGAKSFEEIAARTDDETLFSESAEAVGFLKKGSKDPIMMLIEQAVFAAKSGEVIQPVKTPAGYEIIKVIDIVPAKQKTFDQAKVEVEKEYRNEKASNLYEDLFEQLRTTSFENDGSLEPSASAIDTKIKTTEFFSRNNGGGTGITANPNVISAAFSPEVITQGINSAVIELSGSQVVVLRVDGHKQPVLKPFADVRNVIESRLKQQLGIKQVKEKGNSLLASVKTSGNWEALGEVATTVEKLSAISRNDNKAPSHIVAKAFQLSIPKSGQIQFSSVDSQEGDFSIVALTAVNDGDGKVDEASASQFASYIGNRVQTATLKALREQAKIERNIQKLEKDE
ncbi:MAG: peptidyl-prolyl cis-trans isomerase [Thiotrichaceae bacterium]